MATIHEIFCVSVCFTHRVMAKGRIFSCVKFFINCRIGIGVDSSAENVVQVKMIDFVL